MASQQQSGRAASRARRQLQVNGKGRSSAAAPPTRQPNSVARKSVPVASPAPVSTPEVAAPVVSSFASAAISMPKPRRAEKSVSRQRRDSLAARGKKADRNSDRQRDSKMALKRRSAAEAKVVKGDCDCGGPCCQEAKAAAAIITPTASVNTPVPNGIKVAKRKRVVSASETGRMLSRARRAASAGRGKAGLETYNKGNSSASLARQANPEISGRDLARVVRESRSKAGARGSTSAAPVRTRRPRNAAEAMQISGTNVSHTEKMTGDEVGLCNAGVTGTSYMSAEIFDKFCQGEAPKAPKKVEETTTLSGGHVTSGGKVGSSSKLTGINDGDCQSVTGTEYLGREHFAEVCNATPEPNPAKVSHSQTSRGTVISGPKSSLSEKVSGNHKGTCSAVTGTPYADSEQFESFCSTKDQRENRNRSVMKSTPAVVKDITGIQPRPSSNHMTGLQEGVCQAVSGTPYISTADMNTSCTPAAAMQGESDFPQVLGGAAAQFSVVPISAASNLPVSNDVSPVSSAGPVTGALSDDAGSITGAFSMGKGKVTGTEQSRFGGRAANIVKSVAVATPSASEEVEVSRVTGEGIDTGLKITGNDWGRGEHVTGMDSRAAARRNPTRRGSTGAMPQVLEKREPIVDRPSADVTGGSGGSEGSLVTLSGGARG